jgi:sugar-specific transcriptional regulator TrmB
MAALVDSENLARVAYRQLGDDVLQVRLTTDEADRRYLTGIEIALIIGTQIVIQFWKGFVKGAKKRIRASGERAGEQAASLIFDQLDKTLERWRSLPERELPDFARDTAKELDTAVQREVADLSDADFSKRLGDTRKDQTESIASYLRGLGFSVEEADAHADEIVRKLQLELARSS